jgi:uncharacterized membrane protein
MTAVLALLTVFASLCILTVVLLLIYIALSWRHIRWRRSTQWPEEASKGVRGDPHLATVSAADLFADDRLREYVKTLIQK